MTQNTDTPQNKARVLICDDSKIVRVTAKKMLADQFDLILAEDGEQAWQHISTDDSIQAVFTDLTMPNLDGFGLIERVRTHENDHIRNLPMIVITGSTEDEVIRKKIFDAGATDFVTKPFKGPTLIARVNAHTAYKKTESELQKNANIDPLTGVLNKKGLEEQLEKDAAFANRHSENFAIMIFELDRFDRIFTKIGKKTSEQIIKEVAKLFVQSLRKEDSVARIGLAKFSILLPTAKHDSVLELANRLSKRIKEFKLKVGEHPIVISPSAGISSLSKGTTIAPQQLAQLAEDALLKAKSSGVGNIELISVDTTENEKPAAENLESISLDDLIQKITQEQHIPTKETLNQILSPLAKLIKFMNQEQKQKLLQ